VTVNITFRKPGSKERVKAGTLLERVHYQRGLPHGEVIACFMSKDEIEKHNPKFLVPQGDEEVLVGVAVLQRGCAYGKPVGRNALARAHFPSLKLSKLGRGEIVKAMGLALISRVAVEPDLHNLGIGTSLATECRKIAPIHFPGAKFVEVMTSRSRDEAQELVKRSNSRGDFLQAAGFQLAPTTTKVRGGRRGRDRLLYYWAPVIAQK
jgi:hypothetical protein